MSPVDPGAGQQPDRAPIQPGMHPIAVKFDVVQPLRSVGRLVDELRQLRLYPRWQSRGLVAQSSRERWSRVFRPGHTEITKVLFRTEVLN